MIAELRRFVGSGKKKSESDPPIFWGGEGKKGPQRGGFQTEACEEEASPGESQHPGRRCERTAVRHRQLLPSSASSQEMA